MIERSRLEFCQTERYLESTTPAVAADEVGPGSL
jgi:hypothetical protein